MPISRVTIWITRFLFSRFLFEFQQFLYLVETYFINRVDIGHSVTLVQVITVGYIFPVTPDIHQQKHPSQLK